MRRSSAGVLAGLAALCVVSLAACGGGDSKEVTAALKPAATTPAPTSDVRVGLAYTNTTSSSTVSPAAISAIKRATTDFGIQSKAIGAAADESDDAKEDRLRQLAKEGYNPVIVTGRSYSYPLDQVAPDFPKTQFVIIDGPVTKAKNVTQLLFDETEGTFLAGAIAGSASTTKKVGFIGGAASPDLNPYVQGFESGAKASAPKVKVSVEYIGVDASGFQDPSGGKDVAAQMIKRGTDVIFSLAYDSDPGVFAAAASAKKMAIGSQIDQYASASATEKPAILTSVVNNAEPVVYAMIKSAVDGDMLTGTKKFGVKSGAVSYATSNPAMQPYEAAAAAISAKLAAGSIKLP